MTSKDGDVERGRVARSLTSGVDADVDLGSPPERAESQRAGEQPLGWDDEERRWTTEPTGATGGEDAEAAKHEKEVDSNNDAGSASTTIVGKASQQEPIYVQFEDDDPDNPFEWSRSRKWAITALGK